jgi:hypothetical protein
MRSTWGLGYQHISTQEIDTGGVINGDIADAAMFASTLSLIDMDLDAEIPPFVDGLWRWLFPSR